MAEIYDACGQFVTMVIAENETLSDLIVFFLIGFHFP
jgi:hypothetical protein